MTENSSNSGNTTAQAASRSLSVADLLQNWTLNLAHDVAQLEIAHLTLDSREVTKASAFVALPGHAVDGRRFISKAIDSGAKLVLAQADQQPHGEVEWFDGTPVIHLSDLSARISELAVQFYPITNNRLIAVTGTNGKTTVTQLMAQWLELIGKRTAVMGTTGNGFLDTLVEAKNTTGSPIEIARTLNQLAAQGAQFTALETSSHGLVQGRVKALEFEVGLFTNLSRDHLDYHNTMQEYEAAKKSLFTEHNCKQAVINIDDPVGARWVDSIDDALAVSNHPQPTNTHGVWATRLQFTEQGIAIEFDGNFGQGAFHVPLIGEFNASNVLLAFTGLLVLGFDKQLLCETAAKLTPVIGRMELFATANQPKVVVDYAHTPDALEKALQALKVHCQGKLWVIAGCGGDRDKGKRPMMASIAEQYADFAILSDDNPRSEDPGQIVKDMLAGMQNPEQAMVIHDRRQALEHAIAAGQSDDIILLAGKGHEDYQVYADKVVQASDRANAAALLGLDL